EQGVPVSIDVLANDSDPDGDPLSVTSVEGQSISVGQTISTDNGSVTLQANGELNFTPDAGFVGNESFSYHVSDGKGGEDTAFVTVDVKPPANQAPNASNDREMTEQGVPVRIDVLANDSDPDGDPLSVTSVEGQSISVGQTISTDNGSVTLQANGELNFTPDASFVGNESFSYHVSDGKGGEDTAFVTVEVKPPANQAPNASNDREITEQGVPVSIDVLANDSDPDGDPLSVTSVEGQSISVGQTISTDNGSVTLQANGELNFTPDAGFVGNESFSYHVSDGKGGEDTAFVTVDVTKADVDLSINYEATNVTETRLVLIDNKWVLNEDVAYPFDVMRYDVTVTNESGRTATGVVAKAIVPENIDLWEPGQTISDTGFSWNQYFDFSPYIWKGAFRGSPEFVDPTNGKVSITDPGTASYGQRLRNRSYGLAEGSVVWELGESLAPGESATLSFFGMREVKDGYDFEVGTQFFTEASIHAVDQHDSNPNNDRDTTRSWWVSPITIDLNGDGVQTISIDQGVKFDMLVAGYEVSTGWLSGEDAFLATDDNGNGVIDDRSELFGGGVGEGFAELASFDSNGDGVVNASDDRFNELLVWQDANENAITDAGELISLESSGIASISTDYTDVFTEDAQGNVLGEFGTATRSDGSSLQVVDAYFQVDA
ncbi:MAG: Ig-like domain-containing protein, partial [Cyanobacteria bacterium P01_F01_bin.143]